MSLENRKMEKVSHYINEIKRNGYARITAGISTEDVSALLSKVREINNFSDKPCDGIPMLNQGHNMLYNLQNKDIMFIKKAFNNQVVNAILIHFLNDPWYKAIKQDSPNYIMRNMIARSGGNKFMPLHIDSMVPSKGSHPWLFQVAFMLEDSTRENGCTIVVPGSHLSDRYCSQEDVAKAIPIESKAGDIVVWDSRVFHGALQNSSNRTRWAFTTTYSCWWIKQMYDFRQTLPAEFISQLTDVELSILGFCSLQPIDEHDRIDIRGGYEVIRKCLDYKRVYSQSANPMPLRPNPLPL